MITKEKFLRSLLLNVTLMLIPIGDIFYLIPSKITSGGLYGLAIIIMHMFGWQENGSEAVPIIAFVLTSPLLIYSYFKFSKKYFDMTFYATVSLPIYMLIMARFLKYINYEVYEANIFLSTFMGSIIPGVGIGIIMGLGGSTGGTDIIAKIINRYYPRIKIGMGVAISNLIITFLTAIIFGIDRGIASVASIMLTGWFIDLTLWLGFKKQQGDLE